MTKIVLDVGNCAPDFASMRNLIESNYDARLEQAHGPDDTLERLRRGGVDLVLINRKLDRDYSDGIEIIKQIKADERLAGIPVMLITNYADQQDAAEKLGACRGFGKLEYAKAATRDKLSRILESA